MNHLKACIHITLKDMWFPIIDTKYSLKVCMVHSSAVCGVVVSCIKVHDHISKREENNENDKAFDEKDTKLLQDYWPNFFELE